MRGSGRGCVSEWQWVRRGVEGGGGYAQYRYNYIHVRGSGRGCVFECGGSFTQCGHTSLAEEGE